MEVILVIVVAISILLTVFVLINNKFQLVIIKIDKAEEDIDVLLQKKIELLNRTRPIIKKETKNEIMLILDEDISGLNNFEKNNILKKAYNELFKVLDENEKLFKSESLISILEDLNDNEENIVGAIKFYNDTVVEFNELIVSFPSNMLAFFKRYKKKDFYSNEKREMFEILNDK